LLLIRLPRNSSRAIPTALKGYGNPVQFVTSRVPHGDIVACADKLRVFGGSAMRKQSGVLPRCLHAGAFQSENVTSSHVSNKVEIECSHAISRFELAVPVRYEPIKAQRSSNASVVSAGKSGSPRPPRAYFAFTGILFTFCCAVGDFGSVTVRTPLLNDAATLS
jgi:hypothetical protein